MNPPLQIVEPGIYELIKNLAGGRVTALEAEQNSVAPYIVYQNPDSERWRSIKGPSGVAQAFIQVDTYDSTYFGAKRLAAEVEAILDGYRGIVMFTVEGQQQTVRIGGISLQNSGDNLDQTDDPKLYRVIQTYLVTYHQR